MSRDLEAAAPPPARANGAGAPQGPRLVGRYRLVSEQGAGLFGAVWLAEDTTTGQPVAVRLLPRGLTDTASVADTIRRRARAVVETSRAHPGLVRVLEYGTSEDGGLFAVMERVEGRRLSEVLAGPARPDVPAALRLAIEMGGPVETLHNMGLVHGALRPRNFALANGRVTLMDVETIALRDSPALQHLVAAQSPAAYLTPEQIQRRPITEKSDVYAFAVTLYEMVAGRPPFESPTREAVIDKHLKATPPLLRRSRRTVPISVEVTLMAALGKRPEQRPFMPKMLNHIATEAGTGPGRLWRRRVVLAAGVVGAAVAATPFAWSVLAPRMFAPPAVMAPLPEAAPAALPATGSAPPPADPLLVAPPVAATPPVAPPTPSRLPSPPPRAERPRPAAPAAPAPASRIDEPDPAAVIDWLLNRRND